MRLTSQHPKAARLIALLYGAALALASPAGAEALSAEQIAAIEAMRAGGMEKLVLHPAPKEVPQDAFQAEDGSPVRLSDFAGQVTVVNLWATWCAPCRHEMPSLDALKAELAPEGITVIALNTERKGLIKARRFYENEGIENLEVLVDATNTLPPQLGVFGYPVTLVLDREGREIARMIGDADWNSPAAHAILRRIASDTAPRTGG